MIYRGAPIEDDELALEAGTVRVVTQATITVDDLLYLSLRSYANEIKSGAPRQYQSPSADIIQQITRVPHG